MKLTETLYRRYPWQKYTTNEKHIKFRPEMRMELRSNVAGNKQKFSSGACIQEMFIMMACLKKNEFDQTMCTNETNKFRQCNESYFANRDQKIKNQRSGIVTPGLKDLSAPQVNTLLKDFPKPK
ncbi:small ribosomal subunit protein mS37 [Planococcus citri]|uniref:small ribosomal subunit protein mS37 n=1 Tax=Planococcus citri TaxID=170843 RepID=UPI0031F81236